MEIWDGYYRDETLANIDLIRGVQIPAGLYHLVCEVLVQHTDGDYLLMKRDPRKPNYGGYFEATAGGAALKGEDSLRCIRRELLEETGILEDAFEELGTFVSDEKQCIYHTFFCRTSCEKDAIRLQDKETVAYQWMAEPEFIRFINSDQMIATKRQRYEAYFAKKGYLKDKK